MLRKTIFEDELRTLVDVDNSGLPIQLSSNTVGSIFGTTNDTNYKSLSSKVHIMRVSAIEHAAFYRNTCSIERYSDVRIIILVYYI